MNASQKLYKLEVTVISHLTEKSLARKTVQKPDIQAYYGDHWLFTNIEKKATLDIEIFQ
jgi:hypothetical protein